MGTVPYEYQQQHAGPREFTASSFPAVRCREPWWLPSQVRDKQSGPNATITLASLSPAALSNQACIMRASLTGMPSWSSWLLGVRLSSVSRCASNIG